MQNCNPPSGFFAKRTGAAKGEDEWHINPFDILSTGYSIRTTNSALNIE